MKKLVLILTAALLSAVLVFAAVAEGLNGDIKRSEYQGNGVVEVDFIRDVRYDNLQLTVSDALGNEVPAQVVNTDDDDIKFRIENAVPGETYSFVFTGITARRGGEAIQASGSIRIPAEGEVSIRKIEYDRDGEIEVNFNGSVEYADVKATISSLLGGEFEVVITERERNGFEGYVRGLEYGGIYTLTVSGVSTSGDVEAEFIAVD